VRASTPFLLLAALLLTGAQPKASREPTYRLHGNGLVIKPTPESVTLSFDKGVTIEGKGFKLTAPQVHIAIKPTELISSGEIKLPKMPDEKQQAIVEDPGKAAREMARELELPEPEFSASALQRIEASGGIVAEAQGVTLRTPALASTDGGRSWLAQGRTTLVRHTRGEDYQLSAGTLLYDTEKQRAVAKGGVEATVKQGDQPPIKLSADSLNFGIESGELTLGGNLNLSYAGFTVTSSPMRGNVKSQSMSGGKLVGSGKGMQATLGQVGVNLKQQSVSASGGVSINSAEKQLALSAGKVGANLKTQQLDASGGVNLSDKLHGIEVSAGTVSANLKTNSLTAGGSPTVKFGGSTFTGETITVRQQKGKTVVEVKGEQTAKIDPTDVDELSQK
jgi:lipopolysaccharide export system protein LptA